MNPREIEAANKLDGPTFKLLAQICQTNDALEARNIEVYRKRRKPKQKLAPSVRMSMLEAIGAGSR